MRLFAILMLSVGWMQANSQNELSGQVLDSVTRQPVPFANVYFSNTTIGTISNDKGEFVLRGFASGKYDLTISFVGYRTTQGTLTFPRTTQPIIVLLAPEATQLDALVVRPDFSQKASDFRQFKKYFIGDNANASKCKIVNEDEVVAYKDDDAHSLITFARAPIEIINDALGYKIFYELQGFEINFSTLTQSYSGTPRFEELTPKSIRQKRQWEAERKRAYNGSFNNLIHCLRKGILNGPFTIYELHQKPNRQRPPEEILKKKVEYWRSKFRVNLRTTANNSVVRDSMQYYVKLYNLPPVIDSLGKRVTKAGELLNETHDRITYLGTLYVVYTGEKEEASYIKLSGGKSHGNEQHSVIQIREGGVDIYENGYFEPIGNVFFDGYMMWSDRISNLLPREYIPEP
ncbi:MAG: carboxypeptidase-like regulatory domain-containing protein [Cyclobacteriaceae bacterium]